MSSTVSKESVVSQEDELEVLRAENASLRASLSNIETFLNNVSELTTEMMWRTDAEHRFTYMSRSVSDTAELPLAKQLGKTRVELAFDDIGSARWRQHIADLDNRRPFTNFQYTRRRPNGDIRHVVTSGQPTFDDNGDFTGYIGVAVDVTDKLEAEAKVSSAEAKMFVAINAVDAMFVLWDAEDRMVICNEPFYKLNEAVSEFCKPGVTFEEHLRAVAANGLIENYGDDLEAWISERLAQHRDPQGPIEVHRQNGMTILLSEAKMDDGSRILMSTNITEQKASEIALRESEERLRDFGSIAADWFWEMDREFHFSYVSVGKGQVSTMPVESFLGATVRGTKPEGLTEDALQAFERKMQDGQPFEDFRYFRTLPDGERVHVSISGKPLYDDDGTCTGYRGVGRDISDLVRTQEMLWQEKERAEQASRAKSQFLAHMSHELRTPLNAILGFSEIIRQQMFGPIGSDSYVEYAADIHDSGEHLLSLINDLLDLSKIEAGKFEIDEETLLLDDMLTRAVRLFDHRMKQRNIRFANTIADNARNLRADRRGVSQMLFNLLSNAEKFNKNGGSVNVDVFVGEDGGIRISVADTGSGFEVDETRIALAPFGRINNPLTKAVPGTGLGLPIVNALVELHGGTVEISSVVDQGTEVTLIFPPERTVNSLREA